MVKWYAIRGKIDLGRGGLDDCRQFRRILYAAFTNCTACGNTFSSLMSCSFSESKIHTEIGWHRIIMIKAEEEEELHDHGKAFTTALRLAFIRTSILPSLA